MPNSGWIILDKDSGAFSRSAGGRVARLFGTRKFGHIGTLDPMASGVLAIALGDATKMIPFLEEMPGADEKEYLFSMRFGVSTDTLDITGTETDRNDFIPKESDIVSVAKKQVGNVMQVPPAYSAVHIDGLRAYELARQGKMPDITARPVHIEKLDFVGRDDNGDWCFQMRCGRGTYVRSVVRDMAQSLSAIATTTAIRRVRSGRFVIKDAVKLDFLENLVNNSADFRKYLKPVDFGLEDIPVQNLDDKSVVLYKNGGFIDVRGENGLRRVYSGDEFIGIGDVQNEKLRPKRTIK